MSGPYDVLMIDPPWPVGGHWGNEGRSGSIGGHMPSLPYRTEPWGDLWRVLDEEVFSQAAPHHAVFLWTLDQYLTDTEAELAARGYKRSSRIIWDKGNGLLTYRLRRYHEYLLWYCKPRILPASMTANCQFTTVIHGHRREHSRKPEAAYEMVNALYPDARKLDAFSREYRVGWDGWGNERDHFSPLFSCLRPEAMEGSAR